MIKEVKILILILCCFSILRGTAQNWDSLSTGLDVSPYSMYADSADSYLYITGSFNYAGGVATGGIAKWDGTTFTPMGFMGNLAYTYAMTRFNDTLYAGACIWSAEQYIVKWNGISWDSIGRAFNGSIFSFAEYNNELYAMGIFDSIENVNANNIAKWNGSTWSSIKDTVFNGTISSMAIFNNELYIAGNFYNPSTGLWRIAKWNGTNYVPLSGGGIYGGMDDVVDMAVYDNELYISGTFSKGSGNVGNYIQKWDGTNWSEVGGGVIGLFGGNGQIHDMKIYNNELYVVGVFETAGGIPAQFVAKWNGIDWCGFGSLFDNRITCLAFKNGEMYVGGGFGTIDGDSIHKVAKWIGSSFDTCGHINVGINESEINQFLSVYPNPTSDQLMLEFDLTETKNAAIEIKNILGQTVKIISNSFAEGTNKIEVDVSSLSKGVYFIHLQSGNKYISKKFIKQF